MIIAPAPIPISHVAVEAPRPAQQQTPQETARPVTGPDRVEAVSPEGRRREGGPDQEEAREEQRLPDEAAAQDTSSPAAAGDGEVGQLLDLFV
ncbi:MAG: hypothetical protein ACOY5W_01010 [Pseudomonadota bacterium]